LASTSGEKDDYSLNLNRCRFYTARFSRRTATSGSKDVKIDNQSFSSKAVSEEFEKG
jgi:hypothetical protein